MYVLENLWIYFLKYSNAYRTKKKIKQYKKKITKVKNN